jgi:hypothetical protein
LLLPLAEIRRKHVQGHLLTAAAPFIIETIKKGSPYKLGISKPSNLHAIRKKLRQAWEEDLSELKKTPKATPNCSTYGHPNCSRQDGQIMGVGNFACDGFWG